MSVGVSVGVGVGVGVVVEVKSQEALVLFKYEPPLRAYSIWYHPPLTALSAP